MQRTGGLRAAGPALRAQGQAVGAAVGAATSVLPHSFASQFPVGTMLLSQPLSRSCCCCHINNSPAATALLSRWPR